MERREIPFLEKFGQKNETSLFKMKFGTWINLNKLNLMVLFYTGNSFFGQFGLSIQNCFLK